MTEPPLDLAEEEEEGREVVGEGVWEEEGRGERDVLEGRSEKPREEDKGRGVGGRGIPAGSPGGS